MKILFIGAKSGNSYLQYLALKKINKHTYFIDDRNILFYKKITDKIFWHISPFIFENYIYKKIISKVRSSFDIIFIKTGHLIGKKLILELKHKTKKIVCLCNDNPFVKRDKNRWKLFHQAAQYYDLIVYQDKSRIKLAKKRGLKNSFLTLPSYDENTHKKFKVVKLEKIKFKNDIIFIGTWSPQKGSFLFKLKDLGLNFKIYGTMWNKDKNYNSLKSIIKLGNVKNPNYSKLIQCSKIALCLFSEQNLDTITARSVEIPAIGTLICSFRTKSMTDILVENKEAIFFKNEVECFNKCNYLLENPEKIRKIANKGHIKITKTLKLNHNTLIKIIYNKILKINNDE